MEKMRHCCVLGRGSGQCHMCGSPFRLLISSAQRCTFCENDVCSKCGLNTVILQNGTMQREVVWLCKICHETREVRKNNVEMILVWLYGRGLMPGIKVVFAGGKEKPCRCLVVRWSSENTNGNGRMKRWLSRWLISQLYQLVSKFINPFDATVWGNAFLSKNNWIWPIVERQSTDGLDIWTKTGNKIRCIDFTIEKFELFTNSLNSNYLCIASLQVETVIHLRMCLAVIDLWLNYAICSGICNSSGENIQMTLMSLKGNK